MFQAVPMSGADGTGETVHLDITHICYKRKSISSFYRPRYIKWIPEMWLLEYGIYSRMFPCIN